MEEVEARARLFTREHGKIVFEARLEISRLGERFLQCANYADQQGVALAVPTIAACHGSINISSFSRIKMHLVSLCTKCCC
jgi:hypothetical protein